jgi:hypothetical protein
MVINATSTIFHAYCGAQFYLQWVTRLTPPAFSEVRVFRSLALCVCFVDRCLSFCSFSFCHVFILLFSRLFIVEISHSKILHSHLRKFSHFVVVRVFRSLVLCVCFVDRCLSFCSFSFCHCVVCSSIYGFWLPLWYLLIHFIGREKPVTSIAIESMCF